MSEDKTVYSGGCLCGAVHYEGTGAPVVCGHCHCLDCQKSSGTGHCSHMGVPSDAIQITGEVKFYDAPADSGNIVSRAFCPNCGSAIYTTNSSMAGMTFVRASSLDTPEVFQPQLIVYAKRAPSWDLLDGDLPAFPEMPPPMDMPDMKP